MLMLFLTKLTIPFKWFWFQATPRTKVVIVLLLVILTIAGYIAYLRYQNANLKQEVIQGQIDRAVDPVNGLTNKIEEEKKNEANLSKNSNAADAARIDAARRDSNTFTGDANKQFCKRYCWDSACEQYRLVFECK